jgi:hypothetical protein
MVISPPASGMSASALLDKVIVTKPEISEQVRVKLTAPGATGRGKQMVFNATFKNDSDFTLNGTQVVITLPQGVSFASASDGSTTVQGQDVVVTLGRTLPGNTVALQIKAEVSDSVVPGSTLTSSAVLRSSTAMPVVASSVTTKVNPAP